MSKFISWNVNGLRAVVGKGFWEYFDEVDADILAQLFLLRKSLFL